MNYGRQGLEKREKELNSRAVKRSNKVGLIIGMLLLCVLIGATVLVICVGMGAFRGIIDDAPDISKIDVTPSGYSTFVYDSEGNQTAKLVSTDSNRIPVTLDKVPKDLQHAFVAIEDSRFYEHPGIDMEGILRAVYIGVTTGHFTEGASTITQQLIKNSAFTGWTNETFSESVRRKIQEWYLAIELEKTMSKDDILLNYMNTINLGHDCLGVQAASQRYFGESVSDLNLSECAVIAGITQNPTRYDPINYPENNAKRREVVLKDMLDQGWITQEAYDEAEADNPYDRIQIVDEETDDNQINSYFVDALTDQILDDLVKKGYTETQAYTLLYSGGLYIYSTQDPKIQAVVDDVVNDETYYPSGTTWYLQYRLSVQGADGTTTNYSSEMLEQYIRENHPSSNTSRDPLLFDSKEDAEAMAEEYKASVVGSGDRVLGETKNITPQPQISLTLEDQHTGYVLALTGGRGQKTANRTLNRATQVNRQPGSTFKVVSTYAPALDAAGLTLASTQDDAPYTYPDGTPVNDWWNTNGRTMYYGLSPLRMGIYHSMNIVTVKTLEQITPELGYQYLLDFGISTLVDNEEINGQVYSDKQLTLALGGITRGVKNIELNAAYATIANGGEYLEPKLYTKVTDHDGNVILDAETDREKRRVLKETTAWLLTSAMEDTVTKTTAPTGTGLAANFGTTAIAGKTGTTTNNVDEWFAAFTNYYCCTVWTGYDENTHQNGVETSYAKQLWRGVMEKIHEGLPYSEFEQPDGIVKMTVCSKSGKLPVPGLCDGTLTEEYFDKDNVPTENCDVHYKGYICQYSGLPATEECPFKVEGVTTYSESGLKCPHTAEFMAQDNIQEILAEEQAEINSKQAQAEAQAEAEAQQAQTSSAQSSLDSANSTLQAAQQALEQQQQALAAAQASGDAAAIAAAQQAVATATNNLGVAQAAQTQAQQALTDAQNAAGNTGGDASAGGDANAGTGTGDAAQDAAAQAQAAAQAAGQ